MFDARTVFTLTVSFMTDFFQGLITGLGGGVLAANGANALTGTYVPVLPNKAVWVFAIMGAILAALRGLQKNLAEPVASPAMVRQRRAMILQQAVDRGLVERVKPPVEDPIPGRVPGGDT